MSETINNKEHYDVGIFGVWSGCNYGSVATYYALNKIVTSMGKSVLMIDKPIIAENDVELRETHSRRFAEEHYNISKQYRLDEMKQLNDICDIFLIGSDQVWNYGISKNFKKAFYLDFANTEKKKIAYAVSFGHGVDFAPDEERIKISKYMEKFDKIGTREASGVRICRDCYGIKADQVIDPVFLANPNIYEPLVEKSMHREEEPFLVTYILDPSPDKRDAILHLQKKLGGIKVINLLDGLPWLFEKNKKLMDLPNCVENLQVEDWLYYLKNAKFVLTDSCHGASFAIIFKRNFIAITNKRRGFSRFVSLAQLFKFEDHLITNPNDVLTNTSLMKPINYDVITEIMNTERKRCYKWLYDAINLPKKGEKELQKINVIRQSNEKIEKLHNNYEFRKIQIIVSLLRDYDIKNVVLSPGGRDVPIVRMFEYNDDIFNLHYVTDERSAAYYGLGLAAQSQKPVVCVCTSGTAVSNFLPAVTEAFYTHVPLIMITADRLEVYHGNGEDQTIPQKNIFYGVIKKEITLPESNDNLAFYQAKRDISECILESTHNVMGPVHINIAISNITLGSDVPRNNWTLLPKIKNKLLRTGISEYGEKLNRWVQALRRSQKIMIVYGQNAPQSKLQLSFIKEFSEKFNCVILTDPISNLSIDKSLSSYNLLLNINQEFFDKELAPDILVTVGGKRLMNDPLTSKIRHSKKSIRHWSVSPDGAVVDFYFHLSSILEMSQDAFFKYFVQNSGDIKNNETYFKKWKNLCDNTKIPVYEEFNSLYVQSKFFPLLPAESNLHLGVGLSFYNCRRFIIDKNVNVFCNMGTNGIDGCTSTFLGQCDIAKNQMNYLIVGDLSFFYDMNSLWNKPLHNNIRILMINNNGTGLLRNHKLKAISSVHNTSAKGWVESTGFKYISANSRDEFDELLPRFMSDEFNAPTFMEVFCK